MPIVLLQCMLVAMLLGTRGAEYGNLSGPQWEDLAVEVGAALRPLRSEQTPSGLELVYRIAPAAEKFAANHRNKPLDVIGFLRDISFAHDPLVSNCGLLCLARLSPDPSVLRQFMDIYLKGPLARDLKVLVAASYMPLNTARYAMMSLIKDGEYGGPCELLAAIGDNDSVAELRRMHAPAGEEEQFAASVAQVSKNVEKRALLKPDDQSERERQSLLLWQAEHEYLHFEDSFRNFKDLSEALVADHREFSSEFLVEVASSDPDGTEHTLVLSLLGEKHIVSAIPVLEHAATNGKYLVQDIAFDALATLGPDGLRVLERLLLPLKENKDYGFDRLLQILSVRGDATTVASLSRASNDPRFTPEQRSALLKASRAIQLSLVKPR